MESIRPLPTRDSFACACGEVAFASILAGATTAVVSSMRVADDVGGLVAWSSLAGMFAALATAVVLLIRTARLGVRKMLPDPSRLARLYVACGVWCVMAAVLLAAFGAVLSATTHHRGLGGTTFAMMGVGAVVAGALVAVRLARLLGRTARRPITAWVATGAACAVVTVMVLVALRRSGDAGAYHAALAVADAGLLAVLGGAASFIRLPPVHKRVWVPAAVLVLVGMVGWGLLTMDRLAVTPAVREKVVLMSPVLDLIAEPDTQPKRWLRKKFRSKL